MHYRASSSSPQALYPYHLHNIAFETSTVRKQKSSGCIDNNYGIFTDISNDQISD